MALLGRPKSNLRIDERERTALTTIARAIRRDRHGALRARIVLLCGDGLSNREVANRLGLAEHTVGKWRARFVRARLDGLSNAPRPCEQNAAVASKKHLIDVSYPWGLGAVFGLKGSAFWRSMREG